MISRYPYSRQILNKYIHDISHLFTGTIIDIGGERNPSGGFKLPKIKDLRYIFNIDIEKQPDIVGDATLLPFGTASIDTVLLIEVLEHIQQPEQTIVEIARVLKKGGYLIFSMPFLYKIHAAPFDYQRYTKLKIENMFSENNLRICRIEIIGYFFTSIFDMWKTMLAKSRRNLAMFCILLPIGILSLVLLRCLIPLEKIKFIKENELMQNFPTGYFVVAQKNSGIGIRPQI